MNRRLAPRYRVRAGCAAAGTLFAFTTIPVFASLAERVTRFTPNIQFDDDTHPEILGSATGGFVYSAYSPTLGRELWVATGNPPQPRPLPELCPGPGELGIQPVGEVGGRQVVFAAGHCDALFEQEGFFVTDGTDAGTRPLDLGAEQHGLSGLNFASSMPRQTERLLFFSTGPEGGLALTATDGTDEGTERLVTVPFYGPATLYGAGGRHYFSSVNSAAESELWVSDGTASGTRRLLSVPYIDQLQLFSSTGTLQYFSIGADSAALWRTDGTLEGTYLISQFPGLHSGIGIFETRGNRAFFLVSDSSMGQEIWTSDGSVTGTHAVTSFGPEEPFIFPSQRESLFMAIVGDRVYFNADDGISRRSFWVAGTAAGSARALAPYCPQDQPSCTVQVETEAVGSTAIYFATDLETGLEPRYIDGAGAPRLLLDTCPDSCGYVPRIQFSEGPYLAFYDDQKLWITDGRPEGTIPLTHDSLDGPRGGAIFGPTADFVSPGVYFVAYDLNGEHLWYAEPPWFPVLVGPIFHFSPPLAPPDALTLTGSQLAFHAMDGNSQAVYKLTPGGTATPLDVGGPFELCSGNRPIVMAGIPGYLVFSDCSNTKLWSSADGSTEAAMLKDFLDGGSIDSYAVAGDYLYLVYARFAVPTEYELWKSDGTPGGTHEVHQFAPGEHPFGLVNFEGSLLVSVNTDASVNLVRIEPNGAATPLTHFADFSSYVFQRAVVSGDSAYFCVLNNNATSLWITDGTPAGTFVISELPVFGGRQATAVAALPARDVVIVSGVSTLVVSTDGTAGGTEVLAHIATSSYNVARSVAVTFENRVYFTIDRFESGLQLLRTNGSPGNVFIVADLAPPLQNSFQPELEVTPQGLYFSGWNPHTGVELSRFAPGSLTPQLVHDIAPGGWSSSPRELTLVGSHLFFTADDGLHGRQVWSVRMAPGPVCVDSPTSICLEGSRFRVEADWSDFSGNHGVASPIRISGDTGYFWFFDEDNVELILKVLDGTGTNGHHWVYYGALSNVEYTVTITDGETGAALRIHNPALFFASAGDITAFGPQGAHAHGELLLGETQASEPPLRSGLSLLPAGGASGSCVPAATRFCILDNRFAVEATWRDFQGDTGVANASSLTDDTGYLWFFDESNVEVVLKAVDGSGFNGHFWIYFGALSNVEYEIVVTDTVAGTSRTYRNALGNFASFGDIEAFPAP